MSGDYIKKAIECMIFVSDKPVTLQSLLKVFSDIDKPRLKAYLDELCREWNMMGRGFVLYEVAGGYQFRTVSTYSDLLSKYRQTKPQRLSRPALEVLAIIAYKQPVTRIDVDHIRGVDCSGVIALLFDKGLITISGRKDVPGRPFFYSTTKHFLETFGLNLLSDLPNLKELGDIEKSMRESQESL